MHHPWASAAVTPGFSGRTDTSVAQTPSSGFFPCGQTVCGCHETFLKAGHPADGRRLPDGRRPSWPPALRTDGDPPGRSVSPLTDRELSWRQEAFRTVKKPTVRSGPVPSAGLPKTAVLLLFLGDPALQDDLPAAFGRRPRAACQENSLRIRGRI